MAFLTAGFPALSHVHLHVERTLLPALLRVVHSAAYLEAAPISSVNDTSTRCTVSHSDDSAQPAMQACCPISSRSNQAATQLRDAYRTPSPGQTSVTVHPPSCTMPWRSVPPQRTSAMPSASCITSSSPWVVAARSYANSAATPMKAEAPVITATVPPTLSFPEDDHKAQLTPSAVVGLLDKYIIGQDEAKRAVAIALRNRWRRHQLPGDMRDEIMPKNILMIGPTGCGKTEIARRLAKLADAPFIKVEATKYTELGFVGRDVDDIIKDLVENAILLTRQKLKAKLQEQLDKAVEERILTALCGASADEGTLKSFREKYREGVLDNITVELDVVVKDPSGQPFTLGEGILMFQEGFKKAIGPKKERREMKVREAREHLEEAEAERVLPQDLITREAVKAAEDDGIVFIDEIDKIVDSQSRLFGGNVSSEGVQRDLLPIVEGCTVNTKYGNVSTDHILFICSGAFHSCKPSDMLAELQGRLPIRVELKGLSAQQFYRILTEPENNMVKQQQLLLATEGVELSFTEGALHAIARVAEEANRLLDNIGARRLHTVMERILADISYTAPEKVQEHGQMYKYQVDEEYVMQQMSGLLQKQDLSKYVL